MGYNVQIERTATLEVLLEKFICKISLIHKKNQFLFVYNNRQLNNNNQTVEELFLGGSTITVIDISIICGA